MTPQEIFDKAYLGLKAQGKQCTAAHGGCVYNGPNDTHCGIGMLVEPSVCAEWEGHDVEAVIRFAKEGDDLPGWFEANVKLLDAIQCAHDCVTDWRHDEFGFEAQFKDIARRFDLEIPQVTL